MENTLYDYYTKKGQALPNIQQRSGIYEQQGLGAASTYAGTVEQNIALLGKLQASPPTSTTIPTDTLGTNPLQFPQTLQPEVTPFPQATIEAGQQAEQFAQTQVQAPTEAETTQTGLMSRFTALQEKLFGKAKKQTEEEAVQGIPTKTQAVTDIQSQINQLQNEANAAQIKAQSMGETTFFASAQSRQIERDRTVKALQLNSFLFAAQGNLATAQMLADKAVNAEFAPMEAELDYIREFIDMNKDALSREDRKRAEQLSIQLNERERILNEQKAEKTSISKIALEAAQNGADAVTLNKIMNSKTIDEAIINAGGFSQQEDILSVAEAKSLGVPYGTTKSQAYGITSPTTPTTEPKTIQERQAKALTDYGNVFIPGATYDGIQVIGTDGYIDPRVWKDAITDAINQGLTRKSFIEQFGYLINLDTKKKKETGKAPVDEYGLTAIEKKMITGEL